MRSQRHGWLVAVAAGLLCVAAAQAADREIVAPGSGDRALDVPMSVAILGNDLWVADFSSHRIQRYTEEGAFVLGWGREGDGPGEFRGPAGVAVDRDGFVYVTDFYNQRVQKFTAEGRYVATWTGPGGELDPFRGPAGIAVDAQGRVFVADVDQQQIHVFRNDGVWLRSFGATGYGDGGLVEPWGIAHDALGRVLVTDRATGRVQAFTPEGDWLASFAGWGSDAGLRGPVGIAADAHHIVVADLLNHRVASFFPDGRPEGTWSASGSFVDVAIGAHGDVIAVDAGGARVLRLDRLAGPVVSVPLPDRFQLAVAGAQPSRGATTLRLSVPRAGRVRVDVIDVGGRRTRSLLESGLGAGLHELVWDLRDDGGRTASAGIYFVAARFTDGSGSSSVRRRIVVIP